MGFELQATVDGGATLIIRTIDPSEEVSRTLYKTVLDIEPDMADVVWGQVLRQIPHRSRPQWTSE